MITISSHDELMATEEAVKQLKRDFPQLFDKLLHVVNLTRAFQFKFQYMGCLIMDEEVHNCTPNFVYGSVLRLYKKELQKLVNDMDSQVIKDFLAENKSIGYAKISLLLLGHKAESLVGSSSIQ
ncbi:hypothetical protein [Metabacillus bambusae]|uniref:Uncharacterized protein n=1 Tax=Metabacillus bambusae TaxID=2795218 RepID=A0ABS3N451_9BACI|nr:hypothetical protein [Metabacillus bambusae]MBO1513027.1 hypothetical protein [Metabacillus bambusae]